MCMHACMRVCVCVFGNGNLRCTCATSRVKLIFTHASHQCMSEISLSAKYQAMPSPQICLFHHGQGILVHVCLVQL